MKLVNLQEGYILDLDKFDIIEYQESGVGDFVIAKRGYVIPSEYTINEYSRTILFFKDKGVSRKKEALKFIQDLYHVWLSGDTDFFDVGEWLSNNNVSD